MEENILSKYYSTKDLKFHIVKSYHDENTYYTTNTLYDTFHAFYKALNGNLSDANLLNYSFKGIPVKKYNFSNAIIPSHVMIKIGTYDDTIYRMIHMNNKLIRQNYKYSIQPVENKCLSIDEQIELDGKEFILYISDLHIDYKLARKFKKTANIYEVKQYLQELLDKLEESIPEKAFCPTIIIAGDVSNNIQIYKLFFELLRKKFYSNKIICTLGNHEFWDGTFTDNQYTIDGVVAEYKKFFSLFEYPIYLLENELYFPNGNEIWSYQKLLNTSENDIRIQLNKNSFVIFGGLGFSGCNQNMNSTNGLYDQYPITREEEIRRSQIVEEAHEKLKCSSTDKTVIFVTHTPKTDWTNIPYVPNWIYISGHTHQNISRVDKNMQLYADNQVGYLNPKLFFKYFTFDWQYDYFCDYNDGIHEITRDDYIQFYIGTGFRINFNAKCEKIYALKKNGYYLFLAITSYKKKELKLLCGGYIRNIKKQNIDYYYQYMDRYASLINMYMDNYHSVLKQISREVKQFGGDGYIHGCIIDINWYTHIFVNPIDGTVTPYYAVSTTEKYVYKNISSLLKYHSPQLFDNYKNIIKRSPNEICILDSVNLPIKRPYYVGDTEMYKVSNLIKGLQYLLNNKVIRIWNENIICSENTAENGKMIVKDIIQDKLGVQASSYLIDLPNH